MRARVENDPSLVREAESGAVLNTDRMAYDIVKSAKAKRKSADDDIKTELEMLRNLVTQLMSQVNNADN